MQLLKNGANILFFSVSQTKSMRKAQCSVFLHILDGPTCLQKRLFVVFFYFQNGTSWVHSNFENLATVLTNILVPCVFVSQIHT